MSRAAAPSRVNDRNNLNVNIDGRIKSSIWSQLIQFQSDATQSQYIFTETFSNQDRKYVHKIVQNLGLKSKSYGIGADRAVHVFKPESKEEEKDKKNNQMTASVAIQQRLDNFLPISNQTQTKIDEFLQQYPIANIDYFDPTNFKFNIKASEAEEKPDQTNININNVHVNKATNRAARARKTSDRSNDAAYQSMLKQRSKLPIFKKREEIINIVKANQVVVLSGSTGSGISFMIIDSFCGLHVFY
jgi:HrpA-like RNA helicase